ncbi:putative vomeronasal receptor-like protein 4 [Ochotona curzoniae]|uniref:putative vomeronasal receptor-like protein 4 n=1 Tax=Ochotona curzoniae TaxID=130825 RepID=UPI001B347285|nr:putative vomeronasal receptor-like protein 4 [Ochotona curzoniae]
MSTPSTFVVIKKCLYFQAGIGISGNSCLLFFYICTFLQDQRRKATDLATCHLAFVHIMMLLISVDFFSPDMFESRSVENDFKCKALFYTHRVMRGLSICTTCLLSVLQAVTISPSSSCLAKGKQKFTSHTVRALFFFWSLNLTFSSKMIIYAVTYTNVTQTNILKLSKHCSLLRMSATVRALLLTLTFSRDVVFVGLMLIFSAYMVSLLCRHQRTSQNLRRTSVTPRISPVKRVTHNILLLLSFFVGMYWVDLLMSSFLTMLWVSDPVVLSFNRLVVNVYAILSPLVLINSDKRMINILRNIKWKCRQFLTSSCHQLNNSRNVELAI